MCSDIVIRDDPEQSRFVAEIDGGLAHADYQLHERELVFTHTFVPDQFRGRGIANQLVRVALSEAAARGLQVTPRCPLFNAYMRAHPETHHLLSNEGWRLIGH